MRVVGLLGGMSWESTALYYKIINEQIKARLGGLHSAKILLYSVDFAEIVLLQTAGDWKAATEEMLSGARRVVAGGADCLAICTNTMHRVAEDVAREISVPLVHIADATAQRLQESNVCKVGLLGTRFTMEQDFYKGRLAAKGFTVVIPNQPQRELVHRVIYEELCKGIIQESSRKHYAEIIQDLVQQGCEAIILGCTEIVMLSLQELVTVPLFDTTRIHAEALADFALSGELAVA